MDINLPPLSLTSPALTVNPSRPADSPPTDDLLQAKASVPAPPASCDPQPAHSENVHNGPAAPRVRLAPRVPLPSDMPDGQPDASLPINPTSDAPATFNAVAVITPAEAASLSLTEPQRTAIIKLTAGHTRVDAAAAAGVTRLTLYRWLKHDPAFQCAYNAWQKDLITTAQGQLLAATRDAMSTVLNAIRKGDARLAWKLLESQGITAAAKAGPTDIHELERKEALEKKKREIAERKERNNVMMDDMLTLDGM